MEKEALVFKKSVIKTGTFVAIIWLVKCVEYLFEVDFSSFGNYPRTLEGSVGILFSPLIHGDIYHLFSNTVPFIMLGLGLFYFYHRIAITVFILIYLITGLWVWIAGREAYHIGASGLVYGILSFLMISGFMRRNPGTLAISFIVLFLYGGSFITGVFPGSEHISWESHLMGALAGVLCAVIFKNYNMVLTSDDNKTQPAEEVEYRYFYRQGKSSSSEEFQYTIKLQRRKEKE